MSTEFPAAVPYRTPQAGRFYRVDSSRTSFVELWRDSRSPSVVILWLTKLLRVKLPGSVNDPNVVSLRPFLVPDDVVEQAVSSDVLQKCQPVVRELSDLGFGEATCFSIHDLFHHSRTCQMAMLHRDGRSIARVTHRAEGAGGTKTHFFVEFLSPLTGGMFLQSTNAQAQLLVSAKCRLNWNPKAATSQLWVSHRQKLEEAGQCGEAAGAMNGRDEMVEVLERHHEVARDFHLMRGVFASMQGEDLAQAATLEDNIERARSGQMRHPEVMAQLDRLQKERTNWTSAFFALIVSLVCFIAAGFGAWKLSWEILLLVVCILLVHEAGHFLAMKLFNYRNVRMFFIPFFGAAVSGHHYTAPGWKKVIVSLMGPLPGILLGGVLGVAGIAKRNDSMMMVAMFALILNGLQLLPVLPLDGGRIMHALVFSRHCYLETVFQVLAACILVIVGLLSGDVVCLGLGIIFLVGVRTSHKVATIARQLRRGGFGPKGGEPAAEAPAVARPIPAMVADHAGESPLSTMVPVGLARPVRNLFPLVTDADEHTLPQPTAEAIIDRVREQFRRVKSPRLIAQVTLRVYETLAARPPGVAASIGFTLLHGASFVLAVLLLFALLVARDPELSERLAGNKADPAYSIKPDAIVALYGTTGTPSLFTGDTNPPVPDSKHAAGKNETIIATFSTADEAREVFEVVRQEAPEWASFVHFGQSILLSLPASAESERMTWFDKFEARGVDVFVDGAGVFSADLELTCRASSESQAKEIEEELSCFFEIPSALCLIPPWAGDDLDPRLEDERARHATARAMFCRLQGTSVSDTPELVALQNEMVRASRRNNQAEYKRLLKQSFEIQDQLRMHELRRVRDAELDPIARELADRYVAIQADEQKSGDSETSVDESENEDEWISFRYKAFAVYRDKLGPLMGRLPLPSDDGAPTPWLLRQSPRHGSVERLGRDRLVLRVSFEDVSHGAPALLKWLGQRGCRDSKYEFTRLGLLDDDMSD